MTAPLSPALVSVPGAEHTSREIAQQPEAWSRVDRIVAEARPELGSFLEPLLAEPRLRIVLTGAGTSAYAGEILRTALAAHTGRRVDAIATTDIVADPLGSFADDLPTLLVSFARSGNSPESTAAAANATDLLGSCAHLIVTCNADGDLARLHRDRSDSHVLLMPAEAEDAGFAMTSSLTCMLLAVLLAFGQRPAGSVLPLADAARAVVEGELGARVDDFAAGVPERVVYLGSGSLKALAGESALKLLELTGGAVVSWADSSLGFRHGPKAFLTDRTSVVVYVSNDPYTRQYDLDILEEMQSALPPGRVVAVAGRPDGLPAELTWLLPGLDDTDDVALALPAVVCAQRIALRASLHRGIRPDNPFPDGEVNRVVQGVTVYPLPAR
ncbi:putative tagatose-6-phosphate ketose/aldose isomerase [Streptomyces sp. YIM 130001]|uniref:SIS domain-containing protein n=1 Tax=Streptomyces sp. YIM 130001 TaxID=2259644 RepID=UPI000EDE9269|nr:SIS domain-containing protein [Streptomyces sp. YIM 130001]RII15615.1 putative tagatose-6-phosphate ketose/aldose isomerase [Streptomyces sp. YIM 130001]